MQHQRRFAPLIAMALVLSLGVTALADTIRLRDGSVLRGQVVGFKDQQFTVLIGNNARGRRSRVVLFMEDVESIEFDGGAAAAGAGASGAGGIGEVVGGGGTTTTAGNDGANDNGGNNSAIDAVPSAATNSSTRPAPTMSTPPRSSSSSSSGSAATTSTGTTARPPVFFPIRLRVRADNAANGWNDSGLMVRAGQRLRVSATGRVSLGNGVYATPTGLPRLADKDKLMRNEPTGGLIAVVGDDNDDFIFVGANREFTARRDGRLFLGVNEGVLDDNSGTYDVTVEAEALAPR